MTATTLAPVVAAAGAATPWWVAPAVLAALIAGAVAVCTLIVNGRRARTDRQRMLFAQAFGDIAAYKEFVYIVRRRRHDQPEAERARISTDLSEIQRRLNQHRAVLKVEAPRVAYVFTELLDTTRRVAGAAIRDGWNTDPITADANIHVNVDLSKLTSYEDRYLLAVADHLSLMPWWARRAGQDLGARASRRWHALSDRPSTAAMPPGTAP